MGMWIGRNRKARVTYGFDEIALVPGDITINPTEVDTTFEIPRKDGSAIKLKIPILASAMDGVTDVRFCIEMGKLGGLGVINLEGVQTRYENPSEVLDTVLKAATRGPPDLRPPRRRSSAWLPEAYRKMLRTDFTPVMARMPSSTAAGGLLSTLMRENASLSSLARDRWMRPMFTFASPNSECFHPPNE